MSCSTYVLADNIALIANDPIAAIHFKEANIHLIENKDKFNKTDNSALSNLERAKIVELAKSMLKTRYVYGGKGKKGVDCSGLVSYVFNKIGLPLNGAARDIAKQGTKINRESY